MEFRLTYDGRLPAAASGRPRTEDKHRIRQVFHSQLKELWNWNQRLYSHILNPLNLDGMLGGRYDRYGYRFRPLVCDFFGLTCSLDILFLRRDMPGNLIKYGGDIDNRLKVLFDALRMPSEKNELAGRTVPAGDENPFYCLLEDDRLITAVSVTTDRLLTPLTDSEGQSDVRLVIHVKTVSSHTPTL